MNAKKGKLALNHFCRQAILQRRHGTRKKITLATPICGNTWLRDDGDGDGGGGGGGCKWGAMRGADR